LHSGHCRRAPGSNFPLTSGPPEKHLPPPYPFPSPALSNIRERRQGEVRRMILPRTRVNKGQLPRCTCIVFTCWMSGKDRQAPDYPPENRMTAPGSLRARRSSRFCARLPALRCGEPDLTGALATRHTGLSTLEGGGGGFTAVGLPLNGVLRRSLASAGTRQCVSPEAPGGTRTRTRA
jgi:hypothetical protein